MKYVVWVTKATRIHKFKGKSWLFYEFTWLSVSVWNGISPSYLSDILTPTARINTRANSSTAENVLYVSYIFYMFYVHIIFTCIFVFWPCIFIVYLANKARGQKSTLLLTRLPCINMFLNKYRNSNSAEDVLFCRKSINTSYTLYCWNTPIALYWKTLDNNNWAGKHILRTYWLIFFSSLYFI